MKQIFLILLIPIISCKAQNIVDYDTSERIFIPNSGDYYKDVNNHFNLFVGEWKWENLSNNSSITFIFQKIENLASSSGYSKDLLIGEYQYIQNGEELANSLADINNPNIIGNYHKISGVNLLTKYNRPQCSECTENDRRIKINIQHDNYPGVSGKLLLRHFIENGVEKLKIIISDGSWLTSDTNAPDDIDIPFGEYIFIKQ